MSQLLLSYLAHEPAPPLLFSTCIIMSQLLPHSHHNKEENCVGGTACVPKGEDHVRDRGVASCGRGALSTNNESLIINFRPGMSAHARPLYIYA